MKTLVVFDVSNLAYRSFHVLKDLSHAGISTGVPFGVFRDVHQANEQFAPTHFAFACDRGKPLRTNIYPEYKTKRKRSAEVDPEQAKARAEVKKQIRRLVQELLPEAGFKNIYHQWGYEADDFMALAAERYSGEVILVSSDQDLYQCLSKRCMIYNPHKKRMITEQSFREDWNISPSQWADVKAIAGCTSDNIEGVAGVGEKTAIKFLSGKLQSGKAFEAITRGSKIWERNIKLTSLPFPNVNKIKILDHNVTQRRWNRVMQTLGVYSLRSF